MRILTPKEKAYLKGLANPIKEKYTIGKGNLSDEILSMLDKALEAKELIKISILNTSSEDKESLAEEITSKLDASLVQIIGRVILIYRRSKKHPRIDL